MDKNDYLFNKALELEKENKLLHSIQFFQNLLNDAKYRKVSYIKLAAIYDKLNRTDASVSLLKSYLKNVDNDEDEIRIFLSELLIKINLFNEAIENLSIIKNGLIAEIYFLFGMAYYGLKQYEVAKINFEEFLRLNEKAEFVIETYIYLTNIALATGKYNDALNIIEKIKEIGQDNLEMWYTAAKVYFAKNMFYHAGESIKKALQLNPNNTDLLFLGAKIDFYKGDFELGELKIKMFESLTESTLESNILHGQICYSLNKIGEALKYFNNALNLSPENKIAKSYLEKIKNNTKFGN